MELERGINIDVWQGHGEKWLKAQRLHDKMQTNLAMAKDRLHFLGEHINVVLMRMLFGSILFYGSNSVAQHAVASSYISDFPHFHGTLP